MKVCPKCNHGNRSDARYCEKCGQRLKSRLALISSIVCLLVIAGSVFFLSRTGTSPAPAPSSPSPQPLVDTLGTQSGNSVLKCVVEIQKTGLVSFIIETGNQGKWRLKKADPDSSLVREYLVKKKEDITLRDYLGCITTYGVSKNNIVFVAAPEILNIPEMRSIISEIENIGFNIRAYNAGEMAKRQFEMMPGQYKNGSFAVRMNAGKTVIAWQDYDSVKVITTYGYENIRTEKELIEIRKLIKDIPTNKRGLCFFSGDIFSKIAGTQATDEQSYIVLNKPDTYTGNSPQERNGLKIYEAIRESAGCNEFRYERNMNFIDLIMNEYKDN
jgi:hypothetical protein